MSASTSLSTAIYRRAPRPGAEWGEIVSTRRRRGGLFGVLWKREQRLHAVCNSIRGGNQRPGSREPCADGERVLPASSLLLRTRRADDRGRQARRRTTIVIADMDFGLTFEVRNFLEFFRDRGPETYDAITKYGHTIRLATLRRSVGGVTLLRKRSLNRRA